MQRYIAAGYGITSMMIRFVELHGQMMDFLLLPGQMIIKSVFMRFPWASLE
jgi:hypothetical protein